MKPMLKAAAAAVLTFSAAIAAAEDFQPAVVYDTAGKFDKSFNEAV